MDEDNAIQSRTNELKDLLSQIGDIDALHAAGVLDDDAYIEQKAKRQTYAVALTKLSDGDYVDEDALEGILAEQRGIAAQPSQAEVAMAEIDYLKMVGGVE